MTDTPFNDRMTDLASIAFREDFERSDLTREQRMRRTLLEMSIREGSADCRDDLMSIAYCYHNLSLMGVDADRTLKDLAAISGPKLSNLLLGFVNRLPVERSLQAFGLRVEQTAKGPVAEFKG